MRLLSRETRGRLVLRAVVLVAPVLALLAARPGDQPDHWFVALTLALAVGFAAMPESAFGTVCLAVVAVWWALAARAGVPVSAIPAALLLVSAHVAGILLSYGPAALPVGRPLLLRWLRRGASVSLAVPVVWVLARVVDGQPEPPGIWVAGLASAVVVCLVAATAVAPRPGASA